MRVLELCDRVQFLCYLTHKQRENLIDHGELFSNDKHVHTVRLPQMPSNGGRMRFILPGIDERIPYDVILPEIDEGKIKDIPHDHDIRRVIWFKHLGEWRLDYQDAEDCWIEVRWIPRESSE